MNQIKLYLQLRRRRMWLILTSSSSMRKILGNQIKLPVASGDKVEKFYIFCLFQLLDYSRVTGNAEHSCQSILRENRSRRMQAKVTFHINWRGTDARLGPKITPGNTNPGAGREVNRQWGQGPLFHPEGPRLPLHQESWAQPSNTSNTFIFIFNHTVLPKRQVILKECHSGKTLQLELLDSVSNLTNIITTISLC